MNISLISFRHITFYWILKKKKKGAKAHFGLPLSSSLLVTDFGSQTSLFLNFLPHKKVTNITRKWPTKFPLHSTQIFLGTKLHINYSQICLFLFLSSFSETSKQLPLDLLFIFRKWSSFHWLKKKNLTRTEFSSYKVTNNTRKDAPIQL